jgi:hypothetical protein
MNSEVIVLVSVGVIGLVAVLGMLIRTMAQMRIEERKLQGKPTFTPEELDALAEKLAARLARPDQDRKLLLDLAKMSEEEFRVYRTALRDEERAAEGRPPERKRELG